MFVGLLSALSLLLSCICSLICWCLQFALTIFAFCYRCLSIFNDFNIQHLKVVYWWACSMSTLYILNIWCILCLYQYLISSLVVVNVLFLTSLILMSPISTFNIWILLTNILQFWFSSNTISDITTWF